MDDAQVQVFKIICDGPAAVQAAGLWLKVRAAESESVMADWAGIYTLNWGALCSAYRRPF